MRSTLTICFGLMLMTLPAHACEDIPGAQASVVQASDIQASVAQVNAAQPASTDLSAATARKPAKKVAKKKKEKVEYMRIAN
jgi:hypothetical protein